jgi:hypothetical protein
LNRGEERKGGVQEVFIAFFGFVFFCTEPERTIMIYNLLGKFIYTELPRRERRRKIKHVVGIFLAAVFLGASVGYILYRENFSRH